MTSNFYSAYDTILRNGETVVNVWMHVSKWTSKEAFPKFMHVITRVVFSWERNDDEGPCEMFIKAGEHVPLMIPVKFSVDFGKPHWTRKGKNYAAVDVFVNLMDEDARKNSKIEFLEPPRTRFSTNWSGLLLSDAAVANYTDGLFRAPKCVADIDRAMFRRDRVEWALASSSQTLKQAHATHVVLPPNTYSCEVELSSVATEDVTREALEMFWDDVRKCYIIPFSCRNTTKFRPKASLVLLDADEYKDTGDIV